MTQQYIYNDPYEALRRRMPQLQAGGQMWDNPYTVANDATNRGAGQSYQNQAAPPTIPFSTYKPVTAPTPVANPANAISMGLGGQATLGTGQRSTPSPFASWQQGSTPPAYANPQGMPSGAAPAAPVADGTRPLQSGVNPTQTTNYALPGGWNAGGNKYGYDFSPQLATWTNPGNMLYQLGYNEAKDGNKLPTASGYEPEKNRVYAWMNAIARANGLADISQAPQDLQAFAISYAVGRLRTDTFNVDPSGAAWRNSAFSGLDRFLANGGGGGAPGTGGPNRNPGAGGTPLGNPNQPAPTTAGTIPNQPTTAPAAPTAYPNGAPGGTTPAAGGGAVGADGLSAAQRAALGADPNQAYRYMMQQIGYNPDAPGLLGKFLESRFKPLLEARLAASGLEGASVQNGQLASGNYLDNIGNTINDFGAGAFGRGGSLGAGGNFFGNLANVGNQAAQQAGGLLGGLKDQSQAMQYLQQLGSLRFSGANPLIQQAGADIMQRGQNQYQDYAFNNELAGKNIDPFTQWLLSQSQYRGIYGV